MERVNFTTHLLDANADVLEGYRAWLCPRCGKRNETTLNMQKLYEEGILETVDLPATCKHCKKTSILSRNVVSKKEVEQ